MLVLSGVKTFWQGEDDEVFEVVVGSTGAAAEAVALHPGHHQRYSRLVAETQEEAARSGWSRVAQAVWTVIMMDFGELIIMYWTAFSDWLIGAWHYVQPTLGVIGTVLLYWCLIGVPFGLWNSAKLRHKFERTDGWGVRFAGYLGLSIIFSFGGALGTAYLIYRMIRWPYDRVKQRR